MDKRWISGGWWSFNVLFATFLCDSVTVRQLFFKILYAHTYIISFRNVLSHCLTVTRRLDSFVFTLPNYRESIGQYRSDNGVVTSKTAEKQGKVEKKVVF